MPDFVWLLAAAYLAAADFAGCRGTLKHEFERICNDLRNRYTSQQLAAEFCLLKGAKLDLSKL